MASMRSSLQGAAEGALSCSAWLYVLACYKNTDLETVAEASTRAVQIAEDYMKAVADKVKSLMLRISEVNTDFEHGISCLCRTTLVEGLTIDALCPLHHYMKACLLLRTCSLYCKQVDLLSLVLSLVISLY